MHAMDLKKITELFTFSVPLLIVCSCIRLITYYGHWNIPILDYLSAAELLFLFVQPAITIVALAAIYFAANGIFIGAVYMLVKFGVIRSKPEPKSKEKTRTESEAPATKAKKPDIWERIGKLIPFLLTPFFLWVFFEGIWFNYEIFPVVLLHVIIWGAAIGLIRKFYRSEGEALPFEAVLWGTIVMLLSASYFIGRYEANATVTNPAPYKITLIDGTPLETDSNMIYLGKTSTYCFFHDNTGGRSVIIPLTQIKRIEIPGK
jgi:hypothetical protein